MFTFVEVSKNTYPYRTLHIEGCSHLARAKYQTVLGIEKVRRLDAVRLDVCSRCMPTHKGVGGHTEYHAAQREFWSIQRAFKDDEAAQWNRVHKARKVVALRMALAEAEAAIDPADEAQRIVLADLLREAKDGGYSPLEVTVSRR